MTTGPNTGKNRKKVLIVGRMPQAGIDVLKKRDDVDYEILTNDAQPSLQELRDLVVKSLPPWAAPKELVIVDDLPRSVAGKVRRRELDADPG